ncbi:hypothetical protein [Vibrio echinoideorum]|uniref:Uncharacterized protein n=1 Tax=Vibrio echinoideorum TaxID=2100116 RepID=A0ABU9FT63_9VIBR
MNISIKKIRHIMRYHLRDVLNTIKFGRNAPKSAELIWINPADVKSYTYNSPTRLPGKKTGSAINGDWDLYKRDFSKLEKYQICKQRFKYQKSWEEAGAYSHMLNLIQKLHKVDDCENESDIKQRYESIDQTYSKIRQRGFLPRKDINRSNFRELGGIRIHIDRNGELIFGGSGCHRMSIAKVLELDLIPAQLGIVHEKAIKNKVWRNNIRKGPNQ